MRRLVAALGVVVVGALVGVACVPWLTTVVLADRGVRVGGARWCEPGLCLDGLAWDEAAAARVVVGWDRVVRAEQVSVPVGALARLAAGASPARVDDARATAGASAPSADGVRVPAWVRRLVVAVDVEELRVQGAPLPALTGRAWPVRKLAGEGVTVEGDVVHAALATPLGELAVEARAAEGGVALDARCDACALPAPSEADVALPLPGLRVRGAWGGGTFRGTATVGDVSAAVVATPEGEGLTADVTLEPTELSSIYELFAAWVPEVRRARIEGAVRGTARVRVDGSLELLAFEPAIEGFRVDGLVPDTLAGGPFQFRGRGRDGVDVLYTRGEGTPEWTPLPEMGVWLPAAVIAAEDGAFRGHAGYDLGGIREAAAHNAAEGGIERGGSTLTQQLAKNLFLDGTRSYARKLREILYAVELEQDLGKARILELYLNVVEFGPGLRGARAAADTYFLKAPAALLPQEAAWLASILRYPKTAYNRQFLGGNVDVSRVRWILENMRGVPEEARIAALDRPVRVVPP